LSLHRLFCFESPKVSLRPTARSQEDRPFLSQDEKKERFVSKKRRFRERSFALEQTNRVVSKRGGSSFFVATPKTNPSQVHARRPGTLLFRIFSWRISAAGVRCFIASEPGELREFMEILDTYWVKVFYRMSKDGCVAKHPVDLIRSFRVWESRAEMYSSNEMYASRAQWDGTARFMKSLYPRDFTTFLFLRHQRIGECINWNVTLYQESFRLKIKERCTWTSNRKN